MDELTPFLQKHDTIFRRAIPVEKRVAIGMCGLATGNSYSTITKIVGICNSTAVEITREFCTTLVQISDRYIS